MLLAVCSVPSLKLSHAFTTAEGTLRLALGRSVWQEGESVAGSSVFEMLQSVVLVAPWLFKLNSVTVGTCQSLGPESFITKWMLLWQHHPSIPSAAAAEPHWRWELPAERGEMRRVVDKHRAGGVGEREHPMGTSCCVGSRGSALPVFIHVQPCLEAAPSSPSIAPWGVLATVWAVLAAAWPGAGGFGWCNSPLGFLVINPG